MPPVVLAILKYLFLLLIFLFLIRAVRAMMYEISGPRVKRQNATPTVRKPRVKAPDRLAVTPPGGKPQQFEIVDELILGREARCHVVLTDTYASQVHARVFRRGESVLIEDMGSTNGTFLNRRKVTSPVEVTRGDRARIGKTEIEFKR